MARFSPLMVAPPLLFAALAGLFLWGMNREHPDELPSMLEGHAAGPVEVTALAGQPLLTAADLTDGRVKIVNFWASWCAPCRAEHPNLIKLGAEGVAILGVNYKDKPEDALAFLGELGSPYARIGADPSGRMGIDWGIYGVPESFVIDGAGKVILRYPGPLTQDAINSTILPALKKAAAGG
ncbi:MAG: DsbE family thiol:disulfide interchange protein [Proteobacteria bacterium]|nr:DsbE family thiol:disulfide interchange protein [Pseudomonadota bacterium]MBS0571717.1 DsbE family thiol:disulfide interchange protein [Pseudomonadota bacterium]